MLRDAGVATDWSSECSGGNAGGVSGVVDAERSKACSEETANARGEPRPIAGATQEQRLLGVGSSAELGIFIFRLRLRLCGPNARDLLVPTVRSNANDLGELALSPLSRGCLLREIRRNDCRDLRG